jgi:hypothetical protein
MSLQANTKAEYTIKNNQNMTVVFVSKTRAQEKIAIFVGIV